MDFDAFEYERSILPQPRVRVDSGPLACPAEIAEFLRELRNLAYKESMFKHIPPVRAELHAAFLATFHTN